MSTSIRNVVVVGASYVGRVLLIEPHTHFHHLFTLPRFSVLPGHEHKAFIPYNTTFASAPSDVHKIVTARVVSVRKDHVQINREWEGSAAIPFDYLVIATGTRLTPPGMVPGDDKPFGVQYLRGYQHDVQLAKSIVIVGGGAVGVQLALDIKERYPHKKITLVQSRAHVMPQFHTQLHDIVAESFEKAGIRLIGNTRVIVPSGGFRNSGEGSTIHLTSGDTIAADTVIMATGQTPNNTILTELSTTSSPPLLNPKNGYVRVKSTLQVEGEDYPNIFAVGDIADSGAHKAARPGSMQARVVAQNICEMITQGRPTQHYEPSGAGIHLTLGLKRSVIFRNPPEPGLEPVVTERDDGSEDMGVGSMWARWGLPVNDAQQYHL